MVERRVGRLTRGPQVLGSASFGASVLGSARCSTAVRLRGECAMRAMGIASTDHFQFSSDRTSISRYFWMALDGAVILGAVIYG
jgi:hypothetical protein